MRLSVEGDLAVSINRFVNGFRGVVAMNFLDFINFTPKGMFGVTLFGQSLGLPEAGPDFVTGTVTRMTVTEVRLPDDLSESTRVVDVLTFDDMAVPASRLFDLVGRTSTSSTGRLDEGAFRDLLGGPSRVTGSDGADVVAPGAWMALAGDDVIAVGGGDDVVLAGAGHDRVTGGGGGDALWGGMGSDRLHGEDGSDILRGDGDNDLLYGGRGDDTLAGGAGRDRLEGGTGNDAYVVDSVGDVVVEAAGGGTDHVVASVTLALAANVESLALAGTAAIHANGNAGANRIVGNAAANALQGMGGGDALLGGDGHDVLAGGAGRDDLFGGGGNDAFLLGAPGEGGDRIHNFWGVAGNDDRFVLTAAGFGAGLVAGALAAGRFQARADNVAQDADDRFVFRTADATLWFDANGSGAGGLTLLADLQAGATLTAADILLV